MKVKALADRFGSNRINAHRPAEFLRGCSCVAVPFAGGLCEVPHFDANIVLVNDLDRHVMNLASAVRHNRERLCAALDETPFHPDALRNAQTFCQNVERILMDDRPSPYSNFAFEWAYQYFICSWMTRGGKGGADGEFEQGMSIRWKSGGGDSVVRFRNATESLAEWSEVMRRCTFTTLNAFEFIGECQKRDIAENGLYVDSPWPDDGASYTHKFDEAAQRRLATMLAAFKQTSIVVRFGDHSLIRELYPESIWKWQGVTSRTQANCDKSEALIVARR